MTYGANTNLTWTGSNASAITKVEIQLTTPEQAIAIGRGPCRNSSEPIIIGIGPEIDVAWIKY